MGVRPSGRRFHCDAYELVVRMVLGPPTGTVDCCLSTRVRLLALWFLRTAVLLLPRLTVGGVMDVLA